MGISGKLLRLFLLKLIFPVTGDCTFIYLIEYDGVISLLDEDNSIFVDDGVFV